MWKALLLCLCVITGFPVFAADGENPIRFSASRCTIPLSSPLMVKDSVTKSDLNREARKAALFSAVLPGLGQAYNHKYWKIPLIYGAVGGLGYLFIGNNKQYQDYRQALIYRFDGDSATEDAYPELQDESLVKQKKKYKKRRDMCAVGIGAVYLLNIVDANVDAHLRKFDEKINEKLTLSVRPTTNVLMTFQQPVFYSGIRFKLKF